MGIIGFVKEMCRIAAVYNSDEQREFRRKDRELKTRYTNLCKSLELMAQGKKSTYNSITGEWEK